MRLLLTFARAYPWRSALTLACLLLAGLADGVSLSTLLSLLTVAVDLPATGGTSGSGAILDGLKPARVMLDGIRYLGLEPKAATLLALVVLGMAGKSALLLLANTQVGYTVAHVATDLRLRLLHAILAARWEYYLSQAVGSLSNAFATEAMRASSAYMYGAAAAALLAQAIVYTGIAWMVSWRATLVALGAGLLVVIFAGRLVRIARKAGKRQTKLLKSLLSQLTDSLASVKPLKAMGREDLCDVVLRDQTDRLNTSLRRQVISKEALPALQDPILAVLIAVGLYLALAKWGLELTGVLVIVFLLARVAGYLNKVQREYQKMVTCDSAYWSIEAAIGEAERAMEQPLGTEQPTLNQGIRFRDVGFDYGERRVLAGVDLQIPARAFTVIVGPSGVGKTTLIDLVTGLLRPNRGDILVDGQPLADLDLRAWRRMIGYVPQDHFLLHDTVLQNVTLGDAELTPEDARQALMAAGAWDFVTGLPRGVDTVVGERGGRLSGGQRQRIVIARALAHKPALLILDEATSALDPETARQLGQTLTKLTERMTLLAITHNPELVEVADQVYRLDGELKPVEYLAEVGAVSTSASR